MTTPATTSSFPYPREGIAPTMLGFLIGFAILAAFVCLGLMIGQTTTFESSYGAPHQ